MISGNLGFSRDFRKLGLFLRTRSAHRDIQEGSSKGREINQTCIMGKSPMGLMVL